MTTSCARCQLELSALWDHGDADLAATRQSLLHLASCVSCRQFLRSMGSLHEVAAAHAVRALSGIDGLPQRGKTARRTLAAAATVIALLGGAWLGRESWAPATVPPGEVEIRLAAERSRMTEGRFVEIARELLEADHRYRRAMLQVLREIESQVSGREASSEELTVRPARASAEEPPWV